jgi:hypothetical protein
MLRISPYLIETWELSKITAKEFAENYRGRIAVDLNNNCVGRIVGHTNQSIIIQRDDGVGWPEDLVGDCRIVVDQYNKDILWAVAVYACSLIPIVNVDPYPHKCKKCNAPARRCGKVVLCSNLKCKTRKVSSKWRNKNGHQ